MLLSFLEIVETLQWLVRKSQAMWKDENIEPSKSTEKRKNTLYHRSLSVKKQ